MAEVNLGTLYDFNKEAMKNEKPLDAIKFNLLTTDIAKIMQEELDKDNHYWMLLCNERKDYSVFNIIATEEIDPIVNDLRTTLYNRGFILSIDKEENNAWEIWIRDVESSENFVYYLFQYDTGIIEINE